MNKKTITRRDFLGGVAIGVSASASLPFAATEAVSQEITGPPSDPDYYPPQLTGLRGSHPGSYEVAHQLAWKGEAPTKFNDTGEEYDLVVVGGGLSGLAAAIFFQQERGKNQRILLLDNHDDFGGHARRNEFMVEGEKEEGQMLLNVGGSVNLDFPENYNKVVRRLLKDIGIDTEKLDNAMPADYPMPTMGEETGLFIKTAKGESRTVVGRWLAAFHGKGDYKSLIEQLPLPQGEKDKIVRLAGGDWDYLVGLSLGERADYLSSTSYHQFLLDKVGLAPETLALFDSFLRLNVGVGGDGHSVMEAFEAAAPGLESVGWFWDLSSKFLLDFEKPYHALFFPDGNASVARLMVRKLIPSVADGNSMDDITTARFDYDELDSSDGPVRLRLNSTAVRVEQENEKVLVSYVKNGKPLRVEAKHCILACYNGIIPHLCPQLPDKQKEALKFGSKVPFVFASVVLRDGSPFYKAGAQQYECPYSHYVVVTKAPPTKMDDYQAPQNHNDPLVLFMMRSVVPVKLPSQTAREVYRFGRTEIYTTPFSAYEEKIREQLTDMFGEHGFDADRDIEAITINRWPHGYAYDYLDLDDGPFADGEYPHQIGRRQCGRISIANSDSEAKALLPGAVDAAWRATREQLYIVNE